MDISGARVLSERLAQQQHWRQALAVQLGRQPSFDPDGHTLESFRGGVRNYRPQQRLELTEGRPVLVTRCVCKRLVDGVWECEERILGYQDAA
jgi:hypothetical protein